ncbi:hypothetical protein DBR43_02645 [Pedobacter sp. KBW06]|uniref:hypothetical protein n=1 Tax=Pedobacter sp. KBW06 TaxID=2153359 RepID=UPI000F5A732F|nr:hypothetical protein [Pedobacter sp. KBW06]RQO74313.1 hypothetical protein DBR43_02645 [Pedobacter sp. KBW06]
MNTTPSTIELDLSDALLSADGYGLNNGKMGLCIAYFLNGSNGHRPDATQKATALLDEVAENIALVEEYSFNDGLIGIGWAIEFLAQNNFIEVNTDDFLEDLDDELYKLIMYSKAPSIDLNTGTLGRMLYLYKRLTAQNPERNFYKEICNKECMVLLIDELYESLISDENSVLNQDFNQLEEETIITISQSLIMACKLLPLQLNFSLLNEIICKITSKIEAHFSNPSMEKATDNSRFLWLLNGWYEAGLSLNIKEWKEKASIEIENPGQTFHSDEQAFILNKFKHTEVSFPRNSLLNTLWSVSADNHDHSWSEAWLLQ